MLIKTKQSYPSKEAWLKAWNEARGSRRNLFSRGAASGQTENVAHFLGGALLSDGFRVFKNGGTPIIERRFGQWVEEILVQPCPAANGTFAIHLFLSHQGLREVRSRYWRPASRAPIVVANCDIGELELPPRWITWDVAAGMETSEEAVSWVERLALPWFDTFHDSAVLKQALYASMVPLIDASTALEILIAEFGLEEARKYFRTQIDEGALRGIIEESRGHNVIATRLRAIAAYYRIGSSQ